MSWSNVLNHKPILQRFRQTVQRNRLASTYLFVGPPGVGKRLFAHKLAEVLLCENPPDDFEPCGICAACQQVLAKTHPDLIWVSKPDDKAFIPVETFIGDKEHRRQVGLCHDIGLKPFRGGRKIAIVDDADFLNQEGANSLLKTLEEPPPKSLLILIGSSEQQQLSTITSRSQVIRFNPLTSQQVLQILEQQSELETEIPLASLAAAAEGSVQRAFELANQDTFEFRNQLMVQLATCDPGQKDFAKTVVGFVDSAGKDSAKKRERLVMTGDFAIGFFRQCYRQLTAVDDPPDSDPSVNELATSTIQRWQNFDLVTAGEIAGQAIDRCLDLQQQTQANANTANVVEAWLIDLGRICRGKTMLPI